MPSEMLVGDLLRTLVASKPQGNFLELGTGMGLSLCYMIDGMNETSSLLTLDNEADLIAEVAAVIQDPRVEIVLTDGDEWIQHYDGPKFDLIFADTWPGKYRYLEEGISLLKRGGIYVIDDMLPQANWPEGHAEKASQLTKTLLEHPDLFTVKMDWSTGVMVSVKK